MSYLFWLFIFYLVYRILLRPMIQVIKQHEPGRPRAAALKFDVRSASRSKPWKPDSGHDNWEGAFWNVQSPRDTEANLHIEYRDGVGSETRRDIRVMRYGAWEGGVILWAYCHLRQANRTFRSDRVLKCVDLDTGELIRDLEAWLDAKYQNSPDRAIEQIVETAWDAVRVLFYVSKADGRVTQKERIILRDAIRGMSAHPAIDDRRIDIMFDSLDVPSPLAFKQAFGRLVNRNRGLADKCVIFAEAMVATEKTIDGAEQDAIDYLKARLAKAPDG